MANTVYDNFYLSNEIEDQYKSHLDLQTFCTVDNALEGTAGMLRKINVYKASLPASTAFSLLRTDSSTMMSRL